VRTKKNNNKDARDELASKSGARLPVPARKRRTKRTRRPKLTKALWPSGPPFGRDFFAETLPAMVETCPCAKGHAPIVHVHLGDGTVLDLSSVVLLAHRYAVVAAFEGKGEDGIERTADDLGLEAFPYDLVVRATVRGAPARPHRFGFSASSGQAKAGPAGPAG
jgi:hypothetical protein